MNRLIRLGLWFAHKILLVVWWATNPKHQGALVALWVGEKILLVKNSYRSGWSLPGGGLHAGETPIEAAVREVSEELGIRLDPATLVLVQDAVIDFEHRQDRTYLFSVRLDMPPATRIDRREIIETRLVTRRSALELKLSPHVARYLRELA